MGRIFISIVILPKPLRPLRGTLGLPKELYSTCLALIPRPRDPLKISPSWALRIYIYKGPYTNSNMGRIFISTVDLPKRLPPLRVTQWLPKERYYTGLPPIPTPRRGATGGDQVLSPTQVQPVGIKSYLILKYKFKFMFDPIDYPIFWSWFLQ